MSQYIDQNKDMRIKRVGGFTLAEIAVVIAIIGIAMGMGLKVLTATLNNAAFSDTKAKQEVIKTSLISFMRTNGRLPCPDNSAGVPTGLEVTPCTATAANGYGVVPWQTLGLSRDVTQDGWGNLFSYRVANFTAANPTTQITVGSISPPLMRNTSTNQNWTSTTVNTPFDIASFTSATVLPGRQTFLIQNRDPAPGLNNESRNAVAVIISHGKNGFGAQTVKVAGRMPTAGAGADELINATLGSTTFVRRAITEDTTAPGGAYDDVVAYMSPQDLLQPLMTEGSLKACAGYCSTTVTAVCLVGGGTCSCPNVGVTGTPIVPCTSCGLCSAPVLAACTTVVAPPVGASPVACP